MALDRQQEIKDLLKTTYGFKNVEVSGTDASGYITVDVSFDGSIFRTARIYTKAPDSEIRAIIEDAIIKDDWHDKYSLCPNTIILSMALEQYELEDAYFFSRNSLFWLDGDSAREILDVSEVDKYVILLDSLEDATIRLMTTDKIHDITYDGFKIEPR